MAPSSFFLLVFYLLVAVTTLAPRTTANMINFNFEGLITNTQTTGACSSGPGPDVPVRITSNQRFADLSQLLPWNESDSFYGLHAGDITDTSAVVSVSNEENTTLKLILFMRDQFGVFRQVPEDPPVMVPLEGTPYHRVSLEGLAPGTEYNYVVVNDLEQKSKLGRFRTAPREEPNPKGKVKFAVTSCYGWDTCESGEEPLWASRINFLSNMLEEDFDFHLEVGDLLYSDSMIPKDQWPTGELGPLFVGTSVCFEGDEQYVPPYHVEQFRSLWQEVLKNSLGIQDMLRSTGIYAIMDDHEVFNNFSPRGVWPVLTTGELHLLADTYSLPYIPQRYAGALWTLDMVPKGLIQNGYQAFDEAIVQSRTDGTKRYFKRSWGPADIIVLDVRTDRGADSLHMISEEQMEWFKGVLLNSNKPFKFIVTSQPFHNDHFLDSMKESVDRDFQKLKRGYQGRYTDEEIYNVAEFLVVQSESDNWYFYSSYNDLPRYANVTHQRDEVLNFIKDNKVNGVYFITGTTHQGDVQEIDPLERRNRVSYLEITGSPVGSPPRSDNAELIHMPLSGPLAPIPGPGHIYINAGDINYCSIEADADRRLVEITFVGPDGQRRKLSVPTDKDFNPITGR